MKVGSYTNVADNDCKRNLHYGRNQATYLLCFCFFIFLFSLRVFCGAFLLSFTPLLFSFITSSSLRLSFSSSFFASPRHLISPSAVLENGPNDLNDPNEHNAPKHLHIDASMLLTSQRSQRYKLKKPDRPEKQKRLDQQEKQ